MEDSEEQLAGGNMTPVSRVGGTVRRAAGPWTPQVQRLLRLLRAKGISEVPEVLGMDEKGREILSFLPGQAGHALVGELRADEVLAQAGRLLRRIHDATQDVAQDWLEGWRAPVRQPVEVICHGDFAPYNCLFEQGSLTGVIDFDYAHPGSRAWDLAYALYRFAPLMDPSNPDSFGDFDQQLRRARLLCDAYGLTHRTGLGAVILARVESMVEFLRQGAARGDPAILANIRDGHLAIYTTDAAYLSARLELLSARLG